jgi:hypothetical protein
MLAYIHTYNYVCMYVLSDMRTYSEAQRVMLYNVTYFHSVWDVYMFIYAYIHTFTFTPILTDTAVCCVYVAARLYTQCKMLAPFTVVSLT